MSRHVVIIGGGFAGINLATSLAGAKGVRVTLVDRHNYNVFQPLLYQVATGVLDASSIALPFRTILKGARNIRFRLGVLEAVDPDRRMVHLSTGSLAYDLLVLATGTGSNFFGLPGVEGQAFPLKTLPDALALRDAMLTRVEAAAASGDPATRARLLTVVIAGAGPTGVELAGMMAEMRAELLEQLYPELRSDEAEVILLDAAPSVLSAMREPSQAYTREALERLGVRIVLQTQVAGYRDGQVLLADGGAIPAGMMIWTAGVTADVIEGVPASSHGRGRRLRVDALNRVEGLDDIYAIGDGSLQTHDPAYPGGYPQLAGVAIQQGRHLARTIRAMARGGKVSPFRYRDRGTMAIIGTGKAVGDLSSPQATIRGRPAWLLWLVVHVLSLISHRNRLATITDWVMALLMKDDSLGVLLRTAPRGPEHSVGREVGGGERNAAGGPPSWRPVKNPLVYPTVYSGARVRERDVGEPQSRPSADREHGWRGAPEPVARRRTPSGSPSRASASCSPPAGPRDPRVEE